MTEAEMIRLALIEGAIAGAVLSLLAFLLSKFKRDIVARTLLATVLFAAAGAYFGFAFAFASEGQCIAFGTLGLYGWRGSAKWLALGWAWHPIWDIGLHYLGPGRSFAPLNYAILCITFDWVVAAYILIAYRPKKLGNAIVSEANVKTGSHVQ